MTRNFTRQIGFATIAATAALIFAASNGLISPVGAPPQAPASVLTTSQLWAHDWPDYAPYLTNDTARNRCIVDSGRMLSATRADYAKAAAIVCDAAASFDAKQRAAKPRIY